MRTSKTLSLMFAGPLACATLVFAAACGDGAALGPDPDPALSELGVQSIGARSPAVPSTQNAHGQAQRELRFKLSSSAILLGQDFAPDFGPPTFGQSTFDDRCSVPADFVIRFALDGQATRLGHLTATAEHCSKLDFQARTGTETDGMMTFTAANGDELWDRYEGANSPGQGFMENHEFIGGTGRFAGASGGGIGRGMCDRQAGTCVFFLDGVIVYDASDRRN